MYFLGLRLRCARPGTGERNSTSAATLLLGLAPEVLVEEAIPESPECLWRLPFTGCTCESSPSSISAPRRRLRTEPVLELTLLNPLACNDVRAWPRLCLDLSSSVQSLYNSSSSRWRASSRSSRRASSLVEDDERSWTARGSVAGCSGVESGVRR